MLDKGKARALEASDLDIASTSPFTSTLPRLTLDGKLLYVGTSLSSNSLIFSIQTKLSPPTSTTYSLNPAPSTSYRFKIVLSLFPNKVQTETFESCFLIGEHSDFKSSTISQALVDLERLQKYISHRIECDVYNLQVASVVEDKNDVGKMIVELRGFGPRKITIYENSRGKVARGKDTIVGKIVDSWVLLEPPEPHSSGWFESPSSTQPTSSNQPPPPTTTTKTTTPSLVRLPVSAGPANTAMGNNKSVSTSDRLRPLSYFPQVSLVHHIDRPLAQTTNSIASSSRAPLDPSVVPLPQHQLTQPYTEIVESHSEPVPSAVPQSVIEPATETETESKVIPTPEPIKQDNPTQPDIIPAPVTKSNTTFKSLGKRPASTSPVPDQTIKADPIITGGETFKRQKVSPKTTNDNKNQIDNTSIHSNLIKEDMFSDSKARDRKREAQERALRESRAKKAREEEARDRFKAQVDQFKRPLIVGERTYDPINHVNNGQNHNIFGIVIETKEPRKSRDWTMSIVVADPSNWAGHRGDHLVVTIFRKDRSELPIDLVPGTPIVLFNIKGQVFGGKMKGNIYCESFSSGPSNGWAYGQSGNKGSEGRPQIGKVEMERLKIMDQWWKSLPHNGGDGYWGGGGGAGADIVGSSTTVTSPTKADVTLSQIQLNAFYNLVGKVLHFDENPHNSAKAEVYICDGTLSSLPYPFNNFLNVNKKGIPATAIACITFMEELDRHTRETLCKLGSIVKFPNVRVKMWRNTVEIVWSEKMTTEQMEKGWRPKIVVKIEDDDLRAIEINELMKKDTESEFPSTNVNRLERATNNDSNCDSGPGKGKDELGKTQSMDHMTTGSKTSVNATMTTGPTLLTHINSNSNLFSNHNHNTCLPISINDEIATHFYTTFKDPEVHPLTPLSKISSNMSFPNKFRTRARCMAVFPVGERLGGKRKGKGKGGGGSGGLGRGQGLGPTSLIIQFCNHCSTPGDACMSCNDLMRKNSEFKYQFFVQLEDGDTRLYAAVSDPNGLAPLPPNPTGDAPNELIRAHRAIEQAVERTEGLFLGAYMNGKRSHPIIEFGIESYIARPPGQKKGKVQGNEVLVYRVFGMEHGPNAW